MKMLMLAGCAAFSAAVAFGEAFDNPILPGWYADPQIRQFGDTYWIFPTYSHDFDEQTFVDAFSSKDLKTWTRHEKVLDVKDVPWGHYAFWAPDAVEKDGKYYLFFGANEARPVENSITRDQKVLRDMPTLTPQPFGHRKYGGIGVAVADRPEGPYRDLIGKPLVDRFWNGAQPIDQYVFTYRGDWYMAYGGWGRCNLVKLAPDFKSLVPFEDGKLFKAITPKDYVEGSVIFERKGIWYFMYSSGGWVNDSYCVNYSTAKSPFGPYEFKGTVLSSQKPLATGAGHHSVLNVRGTDDWYICYHRRPIPSESIHHRVTCLDRLYFDGNGDIRPVRMTTKMPIDYVNPLIGTASRRADTGNSAGMMPYACPPFAAVEWVPMTRLSEVGILSFAAPDKKFLGFIGSRQPAIWMGEWGQLSVMPQASAGPDCDYRTRGLELDKPKCIYTPYYAKVVTKEGVVAELAGASHAAIMRFTYPEGAPKRLVFDASRVFLGCISCTNAFPGALSFAGGTRACAWNTDFVDFNNSDPKSAPHVKYVIECSEPYVATGTYEGGARTDFRQKLPWTPIPPDAYPVLAQKPGETAVEGDLVGGWAEFAGKGRTLLVKVGSSTIDEATAQANLEREIGKGFDFEKVVAETKAAWSRQLATLSIDAPEDVKTVFYTAMYHASLYPRDISEGGRYLSPYDGKVRAGDMYTNYSMWDTYRAEHALLTFIAPDRVDGMMNALLNAYREGGWLPKWPNPGYTGQMVGGCAEMLLAEAWSKGFRGFDVNVAYEAVKKNATVPQVNDDEVRWADRQFWTGYNETRGGLANYMRLGYVAADVTAESVSRTQDFGLNDTAAAILADATGHAEDAKMFRLRMKSYTNLWDSAKGRFWPKNKDGKWAEKLHGGWNMTIGNDYTEQSPETAIWGIPYDVPGLIALCGGRESFERKLDDYFAKVFWTGRADGLSCHENETTHHISYLYAAAGIPEKTAKNVRRILTETYSAEEWGMEGNEDCGQMSAWYILSSLGFYPLNPATDEYIIGSPLVEKAVLTIGAPFKPATFTIVAKNQLRENGIVKSVKLNGVELKDRRIRQRDIVAGGTLEFEMSDR